MWWRPRWRDLPWLLWQSIKDTFRRQRPREPERHRDPLDPGGPDGTRRP